MDADERDNLSEFLRDFLRRPRWMADAACAEHPELDWFSAQADDVAAAIAVCRWCLVREECLTFALERKERFGVWGGLDERGRKALLKERRRATA